MKKNLTKLLAVCSLGLLLLACKKGGDLAESNGGKAGTLTASATTLPLSKALISDTTTVIKFSFTKASYGYSAAVTNTLQIDIPSDNWKNPTSATLPDGAYSQGFNTSTFNNLVLKLNVPAGVATPIVARIMQSISSSIAPIYSNTLSLNVTAFNLTSWLYITGAFAGWENPGPLEDSLVSVTGNGVYVGVINFNATGSGNNQFLVLPAKNWNNKYATSGTGTPSTTVTYNASNNFNAPAANGEYLVTVNLNSNTISIVPADYYSIIGSSTPGGNWSTDLFLKFVNDGNNNWVGTFSMLAGEYKFRFDDAWGASWGPTTAAGGTATSVSANAYGDGNMQLTPAGTYTFTLNQPPTALGGSVSPLTTTTYTAVKQ
jgi:hypothetical protein